MASNKAALVNALLRAAAEAAEAEDANFELRLAKLQEFYGAVTAPGVMLVAKHASRCPFDSQHACGCGMFERQARIDNARAALAAEGTPA
jgi:hypothetical protein